MDNTSDANKPVSTATQTALDTKENTANKSTDVNTDGTSDVKFPSVKAVKDYVDGSITTNATPDADATTKGKIQLAGDLGGTAALPSITNTAVISKVLTGFTSGSGIIAATDNILQAIQKLDGNIALKAPLNSPGLTGTPTAPTASAGTNTTQIATTAFVTTAVNNLSVSTKSANYTATNTDSTLLCDASTAGFTLTLPSAAANNGKIIVIRKVDSTNNVLTVSPSLIWSGSNTVSSVNYATTIRVQSNGASWYIIE